MTNTIPEDVRTTVEAIFDTVAKAEESGVSNMDIVAAILSVGCVVGKMYGATKEDPLSMKLTLEDGKVYQISITSEDQEEVKLIV